VDMNVKAFAPESPDPTLGLFFDHERDCPLCHKHDDGVLKPHPDCKVGQEAYLRSKQRVREMMKGNP